MEENIFSMENLSTHIGRVVGFGYARSKATKDLGCAFPRIVACRFALLANRRSLVPYFLLALVKYLQYSPPQFLADSTPFKNWSSGADGLTVTPAHGENPLARRQSQLRTGGSMVREQSGSKPIIHVLVADNTLMHTQLLGDALKRDRFLRVLSSGSDAKSIVEATLEHHFDVLLISSNLEERPDLGLEVLSDLCASRPKLRAVVLLDSSQAELILKAFRAGARGVLTRFESVQTLSKCVRCVHEGQIWATSEQISLAIGALGSAHMVHAAVRGLSLLSKREIEIVQCLAEGLTNREIAQRLGLSQHTIKNYLFRVFDKTGASNRMELLFMLLGRNSSTQSMLNEFSKGDSAAELPDAARIAEYQQAAERGVLVAQLFLAQFLLYRKATPEDTVDAYKWYLIIKNQILEASKTLELTLTMEQLLEAEQMASNWSKNTGQSPALCDTEVPIRKGGFRIH